MTDDKSIVQLIFKLWLHIGQRRRTQFYLLLVLMIFTSMAEVVSIGTVLPFIAAITTPEKIFVHPKASWLISNLGISEPNELLMPLTIIFCTAAIATGSMRLALVWLSAKLSYASGTDISFSIYQRTLYQPYAVHCERNSSEVIDGILNKSSNAIGMIGHCATIISACILISSIAFALTAIDALIAFSTFFGFGILYFLIIKLTRKTLLADSKTAASQSVFVVKTLQEGLGGIRDVLINGSQDSYCNAYKNADIPLRRAQARISFISSSPRYCVEAFGMTLIALLAYVLASQNGELSMTVPILGAFALGAQRMLPTMQQAYSSWSSIQGGRFALQDTLKLLEQPMPVFTYPDTSKLVTFENSIRLRGVKFSYSSSSPNVLNGIDIIINKGERIGFIGKTGSGKSTLLDIVMALLKPTRGFLEVDGVRISQGNQSEWQSHVAHVPQSIFLSDCSIKENIAFGVPPDKIDDKRVQKAAQLAKISEVIEGWPKKYSTVVGERGIRLSGGQRQRIGIARALYRQADVIIFDEATSALDSETEQIVMQSMEQLSKNITVIIVAHRISTLRECNKIIELSDGVIKQTGNYKDIESKLNS